MPRGIALFPTGNKTKMNGFVEISTLLIHSAPKQKSNEWMHLSPFYTRMHGEWLWYAKSTSQFHWRFLLVRDVRGFQVNPLCRHDITRSDRQIGNVSSICTFCQNINFIVKHRSFGNIRKYFAETAIHNNDNNNNYYYYYKKIGFINKKRFN